MDGPQHGGSHTQIEEAITISGAIEYAFYHAKSSKTCCSLESPYMLVHSIVASVTVWQFPVPYGAPEADTVSG